MKDIKAIRKLPIEKQIEAKMEVINSFDAAMNIPSIFLPDTSSDGYFFISYSQKDFKRVYLDLFHLSLQNIHYWYDRGNPGGKDWPDVVRRNVAPFSCKGVIFYISENSLTSPSVDDEMKLIQEIGKPYIPIAMSFEKDYTHKGENVKGKEFPVCEMIDILFENGEIDKKKANRLHKYFSDRTLFLHLGMPDVSKAEKINLCIPTVPLLVGECYGHDMSFELIINAINDSSVTEITELDFIELITHLKNDTNKNYWVTFNTSCLANCRHLKTIYFPKYFFLRKIGLYAFANDEEFVGFNGINEIDCEMAEGAFYNCSSLETKIAFKSNDIVENRTLYGCSKVPYVSFSDKITKIGSFAFAGCSSLKGAMLPENLAELGEGAFKNCSNLVGIALEEKITAIEKETFAGCCNLKSIIIPESVTTIGSNAFYNCDSLIHISMSKIIKFVDKNAFSGCSSLVYNEQNNVRYLGDGPNKYLVACGPVSKNEPIKLLENCRVICAEAFCDCIMGRAIFIPSISIGCKAFHNVKGLKAFKTSDCLEYIGEDAFSECHEIYNADLSDSDMLSCLPNNLFYNCRDLKMVSLPKNGEIKSIRNASFRLCKSLEAIDIPNSVTYIDSIAFNGCSSLKKISMSSHIETIGDSAFAGCSVLESLALPKSLQALGDEVFFFCLNLNEITYKGTKEAWKTLNKLWHATAKVESPKDYLPFDLWAKYGSVTVFHCADGDIYRDDVLDDCFSDTLKFNSEDGEIELKKIGYVNYQNRDFILVRPIDDDDNPKDAAYTLEVIEVNGKRDYYTISNEALINKIFDKYAKELKKKNIN